MRPALIRHHLDAARLPVFQRVGFELAAALHADALAPQALRARRERRALLRDQARAELKELGGKRDLLHALVGDRHRRHDSVDLACLQRGNHPREFEFHPLAAHRDAAADFIAEIDVETRDVALGRLHVHRGIAGIDAKAQGVGIFRLKRRGRDERGGQEE
jgi:hypothetical protein